MATQNSSPELPESLRARVLQAAAQTPAPTRTHRTWQARATYALALAGGLGVFEWMGGAAHGEGRPMQITQQIATGGLLIVALLALVAFGRGKSMLGRARWMYMAGAASLPTVTFGWLNHFYGTYTEPFERVGWRCLGLCLAVAGFALGAAFYDRRGSVVRDANWQGAAMGAASAAWASLLVDLWCPLTNTSHVLFGHVVPVVIVIAVGAAFGPRVLGLRPVRTAIAG